MPDLSALLHDLVRRRDDAAAMHASAPVAAVLDTVIDELREIDVPPNGNGCEEPAADRMLRAGEVAARLNIARRTVYANAAGWPFTRRYPTGAIRFSERGLDRWIGRRK